MTEKMEEIFKEKVNDVTEKILEEKMWKEEFAKRIKLTESNIHMLILVMKNSFPKKIIRIPTEPYYCVEEIAIPHEIIEWFENWLGDWEW